MYVRVQRVNFMTICEELHSHQFIQGVSFVPGFDSDDKSLCFPLSVNWNEIFGGFGVEAYVLYM